MKKLIILICLLGLALAVTPSLAQDAPPAIQNALENLAETPFDDFSLSLPQRWLFWKQEDFPDQEAAQEGLVEMLMSVDQTFDGGGIVVDNTTRFVAVAPQMAEGSLILTQVTVVPLTPLLPEGEDQVTQMLAIDFLETLGMTAFGLSTSHERDLAVGLGIPEVVPPAPELYVIGVDYLFPEQDKLVLVTTTYSPYVSEEQADVILDLMVSVRLNGEPADRQVWENMLMLTDTINGAAG